VMAALDGFERMAHGAPHLGIQGGGPTVLYRTANRIKNVGRLMGRWDGPLLFRRYRLGHILRLDEAAGWSRLLGTTGGSPPPELTLECSLKNSHSASSCFSCSLTCCCCGSERGGWECCCCWTLK
jgi:hypothetical protein